MMTKNIESDKFLGKSAKFLNGYLEALKNS